MFRSFLKSPVTSCLLDTSAWKSYLSFKLMAHREPPSHFCLLFFCLLVCFVCYAALLDSKAPHWPFLWEGFLFCRNFFSFMTPSSPGWVSFSKFFVSLFIFIFGPTSFWRDWFIFLGIWGPLPVIRSYFMEFALHADDLLMCLWWENGLPILFSHHLGWNNSLLNFLS